MIDFKNYVLMVNSTKTNDETLEQQLHKKLIRILKNRSEQIK